MTEFLDLPEEVILEIVLRFLDIRDCVNLVCACRFLYKFTGLKAYWMRVAQFARKIRPLPLDVETLKSSISMETLRCMITRSLDLEKMLTGSTMPQPRRIRELVLPGVSRYDPVSDREHEGVEGMAQKSQDPQIWAWLLKDGKHLMSMSKTGMLRLWNMLEGRAIASMDVMGSPLCWDYMMDEEGLTMIVNVETSDIEQESFRVWRYNWVDTDPKLIFKKSLGGDVRSNWIEGELTGCVGIVDDNLAFIYVVNWVTFDEAYIDTEYRFPPNLSAATSPDCLFIYTEETSTSSYFGYSLSTLADIVTQPMRTLLITPTTEQHFLVSQDGIQSLNFWVPTYRTLWDGRTGVFSRSMRISHPQDTFTPDYVTLSIVDMARNSDDTVEPWYVGGRVTRRMAHWFDGETTGLLEAPAPEDWDVCAMGTFAKTAVWMERTAKKNSDTHESGNIRICFADFPSEFEDDFIRSHETPAAGAPQEGMQKQDGAPATEPPHAFSLLDLLGLPTPVFDVENAENAEERSYVTTTPTAAVEPDLIASNSSTSNDPPSSEVTVSVPTDPIPDHSVSDGIPVEEEEEAGTPVSFGHFCVYDMPEDWERQYGGIYTVDFDDARGVAAFATGSGKIVLLDFV